MKKNTFKKPEHLCLQNEIEALFSAGSTAFTVYPLRATFRRLPYGGSGPRVKVLLSVSKRRLRHATDRNRAKRQLREAYRLQKDILLQAMPADAGINMAFIWLAEHPVKAETVAERVRTILLRIGEKLQPAQPQPAGPPLVSSTE